MRPATSPGAAANSIDNTALPLVFAGVENPSTSPFWSPAQSNSDRRIGSLGQQDDGLILHKTSRRFRNPTRASDELKPISVGPNRPVSHNYRVFAGPKTVEIPADYRAEG